MSLDMRALAWVIYTTGGGDGDWLSLAAFATPAFFPLPFKFPFDSLIFGPFPSAPPPLAQHWCRRENGSLHDPPMETSFGHWDMLLLLQDENPIIGRVFAGNTNIQFLRCLPNL